MEIYFDNAATTRVNDEVAALMAKVMTEDYGNPSSMHLAGVRAEKYIRTAKDAFAGILKCRPKEIFFTSGGSESNNTALFGAALARQRYGKHIITTQIEHPSVLNAVKELEKRGFEAAYLPVDASGIVDPEELKAALREDTILVSVMTVNNEIGSIQPIEKLGEIIKTFNKDIIFHTDYIQGFGKVEMIPSRCNVDLASVSGHKFAGPKGIGVLYVRQGVRILPLIYGGGQQDNMRSGTENVPGIAGIGLAASIAYKEMAFNVKNMAEVKETIAESIEGIPDVHINGAWNDPSKCAPHIMSISVGGVKAEVLLHALEDKGVYVSAGSACSTNRPKESLTLKAIGLDKKYTGSTIRLSFNGANTALEAAYAGDALKELIPVLRKYRSW